MHFAAVLSRIIVRRVILGQCIFGCFCHLCNVNIFDTMYGMLNSTTHSLSVTAAGSSTELEVIKKCVLVMLHYVIHGIN